MSLTEPLKECVMCYCVCLSVCRKTILSSFAEVCYMLSNVFNAICHVLSHLVSSKIVIYYLRMEMYYLWSCVPKYLFSFFNVVYAVQFCTLRIWEICKGHWGHLFSFLNDRLWQPIAADILNWMPMHMSLSS